MWRSAKGYWFVWLKTTMGYASRWLVAIRLLVGVVQASDDSIARLTLKWAGDAPRIETGPIPGHVVRLERSVDLLRWIEISRTLEVIRPYADWGHLPDGVGFYRAQLWKVGPEDDWSNQLGVDSVLFHRRVGGGLGGLASAKWTLLLSQPDRIYFQDSTKYPFHLQFARARLPGYSAIGTLEFQAQSLYASQAQRLALGSVFRAPDPQVRELGIELTGVEAFPAWKTVTWLQAVKRRLALDPEWRTWYMPSPEQRSEAESNRALFEARGFPLASLNRWITTNVCYSGGWALGRLVFIPAQEIQAALGDGRLRLDDILVTDLVPTELPVLAGYLCREPATPNSHVALLARSLGIPFGYVSGAGLRAELEILNGREVLMVVEETNSVCRISLQDTTGLLTPERRKSILETKRGGALAVVPKATLGALVTTLEAATPADIRYVGGKAANFGFLRRSLPDDSPHPAVGITFDLWDEFLAQTLPGGQILRQFISHRLAAHSYPPNVAALRSDLAAIRTAIVDATEFTPRQRDLIRSTLQNSGLIGAKIRFRSSTNVEDSESFSGAGLYDSYSGCLEDDIDLDSKGPSHCDPHESQERGVFRAIRKVYASFYNENAFLERLRHGVDESRVGMAILVHFSFPDATEMANGVATFAAERQGGQRQVRVRIVSQLGAESVTNPDVTIRPEEVRATYHGDAVHQAFLRLETMSTRAADGNSVMTWEADYRTLLSQMNQAAMAFEAYYPEKSEYELDFEFKRLVPGTIGLKQVRVVPRPSQVPPPIIP